jgi:superfamily II DNA or RNA helicase
MHSYSKLRKRPVEKSFLQLLLEDEPPRKRIYSKTTVSNACVSKILPYQEKHIAKLVRTLLRYKIALDSSDTGVGKTYMAAAVCLELGRRPVVVCPKSLIYNWITVFKIFGVKHYDVVNYETIKTGKTYKSSAYKSRIQSPFVTRNVVLENNGDNGNQADDNRPNHFDWTMPEDSILIVDEAHKCKNTNTDMGKFLMSTRQLIDGNIPVLLWSATISEHVKDMRIPFVLFNMIVNTRDMNRHIDNAKQNHQDIVPQLPDFRQRFPDRAIAKAEYKKAMVGVEPIIVHREMTRFCSRIKIRDLGSMFPQNQITCEQYYAEDFNEIAQAYEEIEVHLLALRGRGAADNAHHLGRITTLKREIELRKVPIFIEQAQLFIDDGKSVIIFVNYIDTLEVLKNALGIECVIRGGQTMQEREMSIQQFQGGHTNKIICQIDAGGTGISLHDLIGDKPRAVLVNCPESAAKLTQALGRAARSGALTPVLQRIIFVANVDYETSLKQNIDRKLRNISAINDGDLDGFRYRTTRRRKRV